MKNRIFIAMHYMELGGAEISLIGDSFARNCFCDAYTKRVEQIWGANN